ncbi:unnamed protein product, partial [Adineta ricciae]
YLDESNLLDGQKLKYYDPVPNCTFVLDVWFIYEPIVQAVVANDEAKLFQLGVLPDVPFSSAIADNLSRGDREAYIRERGSIALFTAAHRKRIDIVRRLCENNVGINYQTAAGRTPLMVAVARASLREMEALLDHGARLDIRDAFGQTAETFAEIFNQVQSRRTIIKFKWKKRNEKSMIREREEKIALKRQGTEAEQALEKSNHQREARLVQLESQRKKRQEQLAAQQARLGKKKNSQKQAIDLSSTIQSETNEKDPESESPDRSPEYTSFEGSSPTVTRRSNIPTQKLFAHQFYDVYAGMTDEEWVKIRNAFVAQYFSE